MNNLHSKLKFEYFLLFSCLFTIADGWTNSEKCGIVSSRRQLVYFGEDAQPYNVPWMVSLQTSSGHHFCGGSIISSTLILTAAHCVESYLWFQVFAVIGEYWRHTVSESQFTEKKMISQIIPHSGYVYTGSLVYDIALLELSTPIDFPEGGEIAPVCLPEYTIPPYYDTVVVHGWGQTESGSGTTFLQSGSLTLQTPFYCSIFHGSLSDTMVCASEFLEQNEGPDDNAIDSCYGDSGSGLVHQREDGAHEIVGIVSWGVHCGNVMTPGVYSSVSRFIEWIDSKARCDNSTLVNECTECYEWTTCDIAACNSSMRGDPCAARPVCDHCSEVIQCFPSPDLSEFSNANCSLPVIPEPASRNPTVSPTHIPSPAGQTPLPFIQGYVPPIGCVCVETNHPTLGLVSAYCSKRFEDESTPWCYVEGDCVSLPSQAIPGANYAYCSNIDTSDASPIPRCDVVPSPDAIHVCGGSLTQCARTEIICPDNYDACCHQLNSRSCTFPTSAHYCVPSDDSAVIEIDECEQCFLDQNRDTTIEVYSLGECTDTSFGWYTARSISQCSDVKESLSEMHDCLAFSDCESCTSNGCKFSELANACFSNCLVCPWDMVEESEHCENNLHNPSTEDFICTPDACSWSYYVEGEDWGYYSESNGDCADCQAQCALDDNCGGLECGGTGSQAYCSWWKVGVCQTGTHWADSIITCRRTDIDTGCSACDTEYNALDSCLSDESCERIDFMEGFGYPDCFSQCGDKAGDLYTCMSDNLCKPSDYQDEEFKFDNSWDWPMSCSACEGEWISVQACVWPEIFTTGNEIDFCRWGDITGCTSCSTPLSQLDTCVANNCDLSTSDHEYIFYSRKQSVFILNSPGNYGTITDDSNGGTFQVGYDPTGDVTWTLEVVSGDLSSSSDSSNEVLVFLKGGDKYLLGGDENDESWHSIPQWGENPLSSGMVDPHYLWSISWDSGSFEDAEDHYIRSMSRALADRESYLRSNALEEQEYEVDGTSYTGLYNWFCCQEGTNFLFLNPSEVPVYEFVFNAGQCPTDGDHMNPAPQARHTWDWDKKNPLGCWEWCLTQTDDQGNAFPFVQVRDDDHCMCLSDCRCREDVFTQYSGKRWIMWNAGTSEPGLCDGQTGNEWSEWVAFSECDEDDAKIVRERYCLNKNYPNSYGACQDGATEADAYEELECTQENLDALPCPTDLAQQYYPVANSGMCNVENHEHGDHDPWSCDELGQSTDCIVAKKSYDADTANCPYYMYECDRCCDQSVDCNCDSYCNDPFSYGCTQIRGDWNATGEEVCPYGYQTHDRCCSMDHDCNYECELGTDTACAIPRTDFAFETEYIQGRCDLDYVQRETWDFGSDVNQCFSYCQANGYDFIMHDGSKCMCLSDCPCLVDTWYGLSDLVGYASGQASPFTVCESEYNYEWSPWQDSNGCDDQMNGVISRTRGCPDRDSTFWEACGLGNTEADSRDEFSCSQDILDSLPCPIDAADPSNRYFTCSSFCDNDYDCNGDNHCQQGHTCKIPRRDFNDTGTEVCPWDYFTCGKSDNEMGTRCCDRDQDCDCNNYCDGYSGYDCIMEPLDYNSDGSEQCPYAMKYCTNGGPENNIPYCSLESSCSGMNYGCSWNGWNGDPSAEPKCIDKPLDYDESICPWPYTVKENFCSLDGSDDFHDSDYTWCSGYTESTPCSVMRNDYVQCGGCSDPLYCCEGYYCDASPGCQGNTHCDERDSDDSFMCVVAMNDLAFGTCGDVSSWSNIKYDGNDQAGQPMDCGECVLGVNSVYEQWGSCENYCMDQGNFACLNGWTMPQHSCKRGTEVGCKYRFDLGSGMSHETFCQCDPDTPASGTFTAKEEINMETSIVLNMDLCHETTSQCDGYGQIIAPLDTCENSMQVSCVSDGVLSLTYYSDNACVTEIDQVVVMYNADDVVLPGTASGYVYQNAIWDGACQPLPLTNQQRLCEYNDDFTYKQYIDPTTCSENGCCTWNSGENRCTADSSKTWSDCTPSVNMNYNVFRESDNEDFSYCWHSYSDYTSFNLKLNKCTDESQNGTPLNSAQARIGRCDELTGRVSIEWYSDSGCGTLLETDVLPPSGKCDMVTATEYGKWNWDENFCPTPLTADFTIKTYDDWDCSGSYTEEVVTLPFKSKSCCTDPSEFCASGNHFNADQDFFVASCWEQNGLQTGWVKLDYYEDSSCSDSNMHTEVYAWDTCLQGKKVTWLGACAPANQAEIDAVGDIFVTRQNQEWMNTEHDNYCHSGQSDYFKGHLGQCQSVQDEHFMMTCLAPGKLQVQDYTDDTCTTTDGEPYIIQNSQERKIESDEGDYCSNWHWQGSCRHENEDSFTLVNMCVTDTSDDSYHSEFNECNGSTYSQRVFLTDDCSGEPFFENSVEATGCYYGDRESAGQLECEPNGIQNVVLQDEHSDECGNTLVTRTVYTTSDCSDAGTADVGFPVRVEDWSCKSIPDFVNYGNIQCDMECPEGVCQYRMRILERDGSCSMDVQEKHLYYDVCGEDPFDAGVYVKYTWEGRCQFPGQEDGLSAESFTIGTCVPKYDYQTDEMITMQVTQKAWGWYGYYNYHGSSEPCDSYDPTTDDDADFLIIDGKFCNQDVDGKIGFYDSVMNKIVLRKPTATETCDSPICGGEWRLELPDQYGVRNKCQQMSDNMYSDRTSVCDCIVLMIDRVGFPSSGCDTPFDSDLSFMELSDLFSCKGYACGSPDDDSGVATYASSQGETGVSDCAAVASSSLCDTDPMYSKLCPTACGKCNLVTDQPAVYPTYGPAPLERCGYEPDDSPDNWERYFCGDGGCMPEEVNGCRKGCGTPSFPDLVDDCCDDSYCTCNSDNTVCECQKDSSYPVRICNGSPIDWSVEGLPYACSDQAVGTCDDFTGRYEQADVTGRKNGEVIGFYQEGCCILMYGDTFELQGHFASQTMATFTLDTSVLNLEMNDDGLLALSGAFSYLYYNYGDAEQEFPINCMDEAALTCSKDCLECAPCASGIDDDHLDCEADCIQCQSCLPYNPCMDLLEFNGQAGRDCINEEPFECLETCLDCQPCAEYLDCFDTIGMEECYTGDAVACLPCTDCMHCMDTNPIETPECQQCEDTCRQCEEHAACWDRIVALGDAGARCIEPFPLQCLDECLVCKDCAPWMYCLDIFDGTPTTCDDIGEETACTEYDIDYNSCAWDGSMCFDQCGSLSTDEALCKATGGYCNWDGSTCGKRDPDDILCDDVDSWTHVRDTCGEIESCKVIAEAMTWMSDGVGEYETCDAYCDQQGRNCVNAWPKMDDSCLEAGYVGCDFNFKDHDKSEALCQCGEQYPNHNVKTSNFFMQFGAETVEGEVLITLDDSDDSSYEMSYSLTGLDQSNCASGADSSVAKSCAIVVHDGESCLTETLIGNSVDATLVQYTSDSATTTVAASADVEGKALVVYDYAGSMLACTLVGKVEVPREIDSYENIGGLAQSGTIVLGFVDDKVAISYNLDVGCSASAAAHSCTIQIYSGAACSDIGDPLFETETNPYTATFDAGIGEISPFSFGSDIWSARVGTLVLMDENGIPAACAGVSGTLAPTLHPTYEPTGSPSIHPTFSPLTPSTNPTKYPTKQPTDEPTTGEPSLFPTFNPTCEPTKNPTKEPTDEPTTGEPSLYPTFNPTCEPTKNPTKEPTNEPTTGVPSLYPTLNPTMMPSLNPTKEPTADPTTGEPSLEPTFNPTMMPTINPTSEPSKNPTVNPTKEPSVNPTTSYPSASPTKKATHKLTTKVSLLNVDNCADAVPGVKTAFSRQTNIDERKITVTPGAGCESTRRRRLQDTKEFNVEIDSTEEEVAAAEQVIQQTETFKEAITQEIQNIVEESDDAENHPLANAQAAEIAEPETTQLARETDDTGSSSSSFPIWIIIVAIVVVLIAIAGVLYCRSTSSTKSGGADISELEIELGEDPMAKRGGEKTANDVEHPAAGIEGDNTTTNGTKHKLRGPEHRLDTKSPKDKGKFMSEEWAKDASFLSSDSEGNIELGSSKKGTKNAIE